MQKRKFYISLMIGAICVVAIATVCMNSFGDKDPVKDGGGMIAEVMTPVPDAGNQEKAIENEESTQGSVIEEPVYTSEPVSTEKPETKSNIVPSKKRGKTNKKKKIERTKEVINMGSDITRLKFDQEAGIMWPVSGEIIMKYSPEKAIMFKTLGQYKSNSALIISAEKGSNVCSASDAVVTRIGKNEEIGNYVETSIGDEYKILYGQLENIAVKKGDTLKEGEIIGCIAEPTKYYVDEGSNLYLKMTCNKEPVDPMIFLR